MAELLLRLGANVNAEDDNGLTPLHWQWLTDEDHDKFTEVLIKHGADVNKASNDGSTALILAADDG